MANRLSSEKATQIREIVYARADTHGYINKGRNENGRFMSDLVEDSEVGVALAEYMDKGDIRTYIKDAILNGYTKSRKREVLKGNSPTDTIQKIYSTAVNIIQKVEDVYVCRSDKGEFFVVSNGTFLKWETALRKALELVAQQPKLSVDGKPPEICLQLVIMKFGITDGDKKLVIDALKAINVKARFCGM